MPQIDEDVKNWFCRICSDFAGLRLIVKDLGQKESIAFEFPSAWSAFFGNKQVATVQYIGPTSGKPRSYENVEVRFYREPLQRAGLWEFVETSITTTAKKFKENGKNSYCAYKLPDEYFYDRYIGPILDKMSNELITRKDLRFSEQPICEVPTSVYELPRY